jgi:hypothetical protein
VGVLHTGETRKDLVHIPYTLHAKKNDGAIKGFMNKQYIYNTWPKETPTAKKVECNSSNHNHIYLTMQPKEIELVKEGLEIHQYSWHIC